MKVRPSTLAGFTSRLTHFVVTLALVAVVLVAAGFIIPGLMGYERYVIVGGSMSGTFERGSVAFEKVTPVEELEVGDIVTYQPPPDSGLATLVTHRIVSVQEKRDGARVFRTKGDANADVDPWTFRLPEGEQPRVDFTVPLVGHAFIAIADPDKRILLVGIPAGLVCLVSLVELARILLGLRRPLAPTALGPQEA